MGNHVDDLAEKFDVLRKYGMKLNILKCTFGVVSRKFLDFIVNSREIEANSEKIKASRDIEAPKIIKEVQSLNGNVVALSQFISRAIDKCVSFFDVIKKGKILKEKRNSIWT